MKHLIVAFTFCLAACAAAAQDKSNSVPTAKASDAKPATAEAKARAQKILEAARQAKGSPDKLKAVREIVYRADGTANFQGQNIDLAVTSYVQAPDKGRVEISIPNFGVTIVQGVNGAQAWMDGPQGSGEMPEQMRSATRKSLVTSWFTDFLTPLAGGEFEAVALDEVQVNGKAAEPVAIIIGDAKFTVFFDKQTHLPLKSAYKSLSQQTMEEVEAESVYEEYKDFDGIKLPLRVTVFNAGEKTLDLKRTEIKINPGIEASKFAR